MKYIIKTNNLDKKYKNFYSVKGANLNIRKKRIYGLIGPNGAGTVSYTHLTLPTT